MYPVRDQPKPSAVSPPRAHAPDHAGREAVHHPGRDGRHPGRDGRRGPGTRRDVHHHGRVERLQPRGGRERPPQLRVRVLLQQHATTTPSVPMLSAKGFQFLSRIPFSPSTLSQIYLSRVDHGRLLLLLLLRLLRRTVGRLSVSDVDGHVDADVALRCPLGAGPGPAGGRPRRAGDPGDALHVKRTKKMV